MMRQSEDMAECPSAAGATIPMRIAVGIATRGRPEILRETLRELERQTHPPARIVVSHVVWTDVAGSGSPVPGLPQIEFL
ncbi:MAG TPA: glycosyltransferase, partial [Acetobacteraceae bacterium]|nr:glycosyltransferase [Acetobacteraceae bacterium]